jgi:chemotaxis family two-component system sensor histidine kinase/response regulator PixL
MSLNSDIRDQAYQFFIEEAQELLQSIEEGLLTLKEDRTTPKIHSLMRAAHSIKGGAASVELDAIKTIAHRLEDYFKALYSDSIDFTSELESLLLQAFDCLRNPLTEQMDTGTFDAEEALLSADPIFAHLEELLGDALKQADNTYIPSSTDLGIDIVSSIFDVDVAQGIERLNNAIANPSNYELVGEIKTQAEVFAGFAELLGLPGFGAIAQAAMSAVKIHPASALEIAQLMLTDCQIARDLVLAGDRASGGNPSAALVALSEGSSLGAIGTSASANLTEIAAFDDIFGAEIESLPTERSEEPSFESEEFALDDIFATDLASPVADLAEPTRDTVDNDDLLDSNITFGQTDATVLQAKATDTPQLDDLFGEELANFEIEAAVNSPAVDDIFDTNLTTLQNELTDFESSQVETSSSETDDIFDIDVTFLQADTFAFASEARSAQESSDSDIAPADAFSAEALAATQAHILEEFESESVSLDDIFGEDLEDLQTSILKARKELTQSDRLATNLNRAEEIAKNLEQAIDSIAQDFTQLPSLEDTSTLTPTPQPDQPQEIARTKSGEAKQEQKQTKTTTPNQETALGGNLSVRVDLSRLERMNNLIGELVINRNSLSLQNDQLQGNVKELLTRFSRFREMTGKMREISDQMLIESESSKVSQASSSALQQQEESITRETNFDSLEMDSYSRIHMLLQEVLEEMVQLEEAVEDITLFARQSNLTIEQQRQMVAQMRDELMWARMLPLNQVLQRFPRTLRDLSNQYNKPVDLKMTGTEVLVDKAVLEKLHDPLLHLLRNGFDHGIESTEARRQLGKSEQGQIEIYAYYQGNQTIIEVKDDGQGLNLARIKAKAIQNGLLSAAQAASVSDDRLLDFIFEPGFSTAKKLSEISGRGVGLDVVRSQIQAMKGTVTVNSVSGKGTTFTLRLPLTLTIAKILVCLTASGAVAFPSDSIEEIIIPEKNQLKLSSKQRFLFWSDRLIPIHPLGEMLQYNCSFTVDNSSKTFDTIAVPEDWELPVLLMRQGQQIIALEVERLITEQELVVKPFGTALAAPKYSYGCTILGDGTLIPVINGAVLIEEFLEPSVSQATTTHTSKGAIEVSDWEEAEEEAEDPTIITAKASPKAIQAPTILVVDDSAALRRTLALSLEKNGYQVLQAKDGREALEQMHKHSQINLVICDVEMPNMNGFEFLGMRRKEANLTRTPVAMLTSRSSEKHRSLAKQLGANAYFTKPYIEQEFLGEIRKLVNSCTKLNS